MLVLLVLVAAGPLRLDPALPCGLSTELNEALKAQRVELAPGWVLAARADREAIELRLTDAKMVVQAARRLAPRPEDCPALPRTIALLVKSWLMNPFALPPPAPRRPRPIPVATAPEPRPEAEAEPVSLPEPEPEPVPEAGPAPEADPDLRRESLTNPAPPRPDSFGLAILASGGGGFGNADSATAVGTATLDWTLTRRWGLALELGLHSDRTRTLGANAISAQLRWVGLAGRVALITGEDHQLFLSLGGQFVQLAITSRSASLTTGGADVFLPALATHLEHRFALIRSLFALARFSIHARIRPEIVLLEDVQLSVPPWGFGLQIGLGWNLL